MFKKIVASFLLVSLSAQVLATMKTVQIEDPLANVIELGQFVLDEIIVTVYGPERTRVICRSEVERLSIDGRKRTMEDVVFEELLFQETLRYKVPMDDSVIDKYIASLRREHNLSLDDIKGIFKNSGYSYEEGREQLRLMYAANSMLEHKVAARLIVPRDDIIKYYNEHPEHKEAKFELEIAFVPLEADVSVEKQQKELAEKIKRGSTHLFEWRDPVWLKDSEIASAISFVKNMKAGDISAPQLVKGGFEVYRLKEHKAEHLVSLEKRYKAIEDELRAPRYNQLLAEYRVQVFKDATIVEYVAPISA